MRVRTEDSRKIDKRCLRCGTPFRARPGNSDYCSRSCAVTAFYEVKGTKATKNYRGVCEVCQKPYQRKYFYKGGRTCGVKCAAILRSREIPPKRPKWTEFPSNMEWTPGAITDAGYVAVYLPEHPGATKKGRILEHRLVMERHIGRFLEPWEKVHHRNGMKADNRIDNLEIVTHTRPNGWVICPHCRKSFQVH